jgi:glycosyltransferase involved in cell wall biosynthesis
MRASPLHPPDPTLDLALVVPVHDDADGLARLLGCARAMGCFAQIVVVDDGSASPVAAAPDITLLRNQTALGPGRARNIGLAAVRCEYLLFLDADDLLTSDLPWLLADLAEAVLAEGPFDFCLFKHADARVAAEPRWGQPHWDEDLWLRAGHAIGALRPAQRAALPLLAQTANYPWNKIYRLAFLQGEAIGCATTMVHEDVLLHWRGFLSAARVLVSDRVCVWHHADPNGTRLTNRTGVTRLQIFDALTPVADALAKASPDWQQAFAQFALGLFDWAEDQIDASLKPQLRRGTGEWVALHLAPWAPALGSLSPDLAARLVAPPRKGAP